MLERGVANLSQKKWEKRASTGGKQGKFLPSAPGALTFPPEGGLRVTFGWGPMWIFCCLCHVRVLVQSWVDFKVVTGKLKYYLALCRNTPFGGTMLNIRK